MADKEKGFFARRLDGAKGYVGRRFGNEFINGVGRQALSDGLKGARENLQPNKLDPDEFRAGLNGRYADGGASRFAEMVRDRKLSDQDLDQLARLRRRDSRIMYAAAGFFFVVGLYMILTSGSFTDGVQGMATAFCCFIFGIIGVRNDFGRWQIEQRRFGAFREYLSGRAGA